MRQRYRVKASREGMLWLGEFPADSLEEELEPDGFLGHFLRAVFVESSPDRIEIVRIEEVAP